jgi:alpha-L-fucosidase
VVYATLLGEPKTNTITIKSLTPKAGSEISLLGEKKTLVWSQEGENIRVTLPAKLPGKYAYVLRIAGPIS